MYLSIASIRFGAWSEGERTVMIRVQIIVLTGLVTALSPSLPAAARNESAPAHARQAATEPGTPSALGRQIQEAAGGQH